MGMDRANHGGVAVSVQNAFRNNYRPDSNYGGYNMDPRKYGHGGPQYENGFKYDTTKFDQVQSYSGGTNSPHGSMSSGRNSRDQERSPVTSLAALDKKISVAQAEMNQALQDATTKENEKFDLIFSILLELQNRQGKLEESVKSLKAQLDCNAQQTPMSSNGNSMQVNGQPMAFVAGQMGMNQQFQGMVSPDGSGSYFTPVMMVPQTGVPVHFVQQMVGPGVVMQAMPQQMVQFIAPAQASDGFQWEGTNNNSNGDNTSNGSTTTGGTSGSDNAELTAKETASGSDNGTDE
jgi:hypothetical protein